MKSLELVRSHKSAAFSLSCSGSGEYASADALSRNRRYAHCSVCGKHGAVSSRGKVRAHKPA